MTSKAELQRSLDAHTEAYTKTRNDWMTASNERNLAHKHLEAFKRENEELAHSVDHLSDDVHTLQHLLEDILTLEPQLKHYLTDGDWDVERINRAAEHLRGEEALDSLGYTDACVFPENVIPIFPPTPGRGAA